MVAELAITVHRLRVHTVLPAVTHQLCDHWKRFLHGRTAEAPHTTTWEQLERSSSEPYRDRNERLVELGRDLLLAFPARSVNQPRSGVTMTINIARRAGVEVLPKVLHA